MRLSAACILVYAANVVVGRAAVSLHWSVPRLGDVAEFLAVLVGVVLFVFALVVDEVVTRSHAQGR